MQSGDTSEPVHTQGAENAERAEEAGVCVIAKNEELYIDEWVQYQLKLGFGRIYVYDNSDDNSLKLQLARYPAVTVIHYPGRVMQMPAYNHCIQTFAPRHTWMAFIDADEFIVLRKHTTIVDLLREHCASGALCLNWYLFGSNHRKEYEPAPVTQRFLMRQQTLNEHVKTIAKTSDLFSMGANPHCAVLRENAYAHDTSGQPVYGPFNWSATDEVACIHHYFCKSFAEFEKKRARGKADSLEIRDIAEFGAHDKNDVFDDRAWTFFSSV